MGSQVASDLLASPGSALPGAESGLAHLTLIRDQRHHPGVIFRRQGSEAQVVEPHLHSRVKASACIKPRDLTEQRGSDLANRRRDESWCYAEHNDLKEI